MPTGWGRNPSRPFVPTGRSWLLGCARGFRVSLKRPGRAGHQPDGGWMPVPMFIRGPRAASFASPSLAPHGWGVGPTAPRESPRGHSGACPMGESVVKHRGRVGGRVSAEPEKSKRPRCNKHAGGCATRPRLGWAASQRVSPWCPEPRGQPASAALPVSANRSLPVGRARTRTHVVIQCHLVVLHLPVEY